MKKNLSDLMKLLEDRKYIDGYIPKDEQIVLKIHDKRVGTINNIVTLSGLAKAGKSSFLSSIIASAYSWDNKVFGISLTPTSERPCICLIDTESSEWDFYANLSRIKNFAKIDKFPPTFNAFSCREDDPATIRLLIETYLQAFPCSVIIIDGTLDILSNFNDEVESKKAVQWLKMITKKYNCLCISVIHLARKESQLLGHFGAMLERYSQSVLEVAKDRETKIMELKAKFMRSDADFNTIAIDRINGEFVLCNPVPEKVATIKKGSK